MKTVELTDPGQPFLEALLQSAGEPMMLCVDGNSIGTVTPARPQSRPAFGRTRCHGRCSKRPRGGGLFRFPLAEFLAQAATCPTCFGDCR